MDHKPIKPVQAAIVPKSDKIPIQAIASRVNNQIVQAVRMCQMQAGSTNPACRNQTCNCKQVKLPHIRVTPESSSSAPASKHGSSNSGRTQTSTQSSSQNNQSKSSTGVLQAIVRDKKPTSGNKEIRITSSSPSSSPSATSSSVQPVVVEERIHSHSNVHAHSTSSTPSSRSRGMGLGMNVGAPRRRTHHANDEGSYIGRRPKPTPHQLLLLKQQQQQGDQAVGSLATTIFAHMLSDDVSDVPTRRSHRVSKTARLNAAVASLAKEEPSEEEDEETDESDEERRQQRRHQREQRKRKMIERDEEGGGTDGLYEAGEEEGDPDGEYQEGVDEEQPRRARRQIAHAEEEDVGSSSSKRRTPRVSPRNLGANTSANSRKKQRNDGGGGDDDFEDTGGGGGGAGRTRRGRSDNNQMDAADGESTPRGGNGENGEGTKNEGLDLLLSMLENNKSPDAQSGQNPSSNSTLLVQSLENENNTPSRKRSRDSPAEKTLSKSSSARRTPPVTGRSRSSKDSGSKNSKSSPPLKSINENSSNSNDKVKSEQQALTDLLQQQGAQMALLSGLNPAMWLGMGAAAGATGAALGQAELVRQSQLLGLLGLGLPGLSASASNQALASFSSSMSGAATSTAASQAAQQAQAAQAAQAQAQAAQLAALSNPLLASQLMMGGLAASPFLSSQLGQMAQMQQLLSLLPQAQQQQLQQLQQQQQQVLQSQSQSQSQSQPQSSPQSPQQPQAQLAQAAQKPQSSQPLSPPQASSTLQTAQSQQASQKVSSQTPAHTSPKPLSQSQPLPSSPPSQSRAPPQQTPPLQQAPEPKPSAVLPIVSEPKASVVLPTTASSSTTATAAATTASAAPVLVKTEKSPSPTPSVQASTPPSQTAHTSPKLPSASTSQPVSSASVSTSSSITSASAPSTMTSLHSATQQEELFNNLQLAQIMQLNQLSQLSTLGALGGLGGLGGMNNNQSSAAATIQQLQLQHQQLMRQLGGAGSGLESLLGLPSMPPSAANTNATAGASVASSASVHASPATTPASATTSIMHDIDEAASDHGNSVPKRLAPSATEHSNNNKNRQGKPHATTVFPPLSMLGSVPASALSSSSASTVSSSSDRQHRDKAHHPTVVAQLRTTSAVPALPAENMGNDLPSHLAPVAPMMFAAGMQPTLSNVATLLNWLDISDRAHAKPSEKKDEDAAVLAMMAREPSLVQIALFAKQLMLSNETSTAPTAGSSIPTVTPAVTLTSSSPATLGHTSNGSSMGSMLPIAGIVNPIISSNPIRKKVKKRKIVKPSTGAINPSSTDSHVSISASVSTPTPAASSPVQEPDTLRYDYTNRTGVKKENNNTIIIPNTEVKSEPTSKTSPPSDVPSLLSFLFPISGGIGLAGNSASFDEHSRSSLTMAEVKRPAYVEETPSDTDTIKSKFAESGELLKNSDVKQPPFRGDGLSPKSITDANESENEHSD